MIKKKEINNIEENQNSENMKNDKTETVENTVFDAGNEKRKNNRRNDERRLKERRGKHRRARDKNEVTIKESAVVTQLKSEVAGKDDEINELKKEVDSIKDLIQRRQADFENFKKRNLKQQEDFKKFAIKKFALNIIEINDDLLRAIESISVPEGEPADKKAFSSFVEGVSMISKQIESALNKSGIEEIDALGQNFNPNFHEAVEIEEAGGVTIDMVTKVHQKGFRIDDLVVRSAKVKVSKPAKYDTKEDSKSDSKDASIDNENNTGPEAV